MLESLLSVMVASFRVGGMLISMPVFGAGPFPPQLKFFFAIACGILLRAFVPAVPMSIFSANSTSVLFIAHEVGIGLLIGFGARMVFLMVSMTLEYIGLQVGFSIANLFDPQNNAQVSIVAQLFIVLSVLAFFAGNLHHELFRVLVHSYTVMPPGLPDWTDGSIGERLANFLAQGFALALRLSMPIIILMLIINILMGIVSRTAPQMNLFFNISFVVNLVSGLLLLTLITPQILNTMNHFAYQLATHGFGLW